MPNDEKRQTELVQSWEITRGHLSRARILLPQSGATTAECKAALAEYDEWMYHNELELALDELEYLGDKMQPDPAFWTELERVASNMHLTDRAARYESRASS